MGARIIEVVNNNGDDYDNRVGSHLAQESSGLSCEQENELLDDRFSKNCLCASNWPSCEQNEGNNTILLFRGIFVNFKQGITWWAVSDGNEHHKVDLNCAFCSCKHAWDLDSSLCFKQKGVKDYRVSADQNYVCENDHFSEHGPIIWCTTCFVVRTPIYRIILGPILKFVCENGHVLEAWINNLVYMFCSKITCLPNYP